MTEAEQQKIAALSRCTIHPASQDIEAVNGFKWLLEHDKEGPLTPTLKFRLERLLWRYRRQLAMKKLPFTIPDQCPEWHGPEKDPDVHVQETLF